MKLDNSWGCSNEPILKNKIKNNLQNDVLPWQNFVNKFQEHQFYFTDKQNLFQNPFL